MSPLKIKMLLHYYSHTSDYAAYVYTAEPEHAKSNAVADALSNMLGDDLLTCTYGDIAWATSQCPFAMNAAEVFFKITDKGRAMVEHLMAVQIPVCKWVQPEQVPV